MKRILILAAVATMLAASAWTSDALAGRGNLKNRMAYRQSQNYPWHGGYYDAAWGAPVAVVVPPTVETQSHLGWGVGATRVTSIQHQYQRNYPGQQSSPIRTRFQATPAWPSSTDQFGDYYIRGPW